MTYKRLFILVEGNDDERFFEGIIIPLFENNYDLVFIWKYAHETKKRRNAFIRSIKNMYADYIFVSDINNNPCVSAKKVKTNEKYPIIDENKIAVIIKEIESWYLAGLSDKDSKEFTGKKFNDTNTIIKEQFDKLIPNKSSRINFMIEILNHFSVNIAKKKNTSFNYFMEKYTNI